MSESKTANEALVTTKILLFKVMKKLFSLTYHLKKAFLGMKVMFVLLEMFRKISDPLCKNGNLNLRGTGVGRVCTELFHYNCFLILSKHKTHLVFI